MQTFYFCLAGTPCDQDMTKFKLFVYVFAHKIKICAETIFEKLNIKFFLYGAFMSAPH